MVAAKWQQANGAKKCENGWPKTVRNRQVKSAKTSEKVRKRSKTGEEVRKRSGCFFVIVFWPFAVAIERWLFRFSLEERKLSIG